MLTIPKNAYYTALPVLPSSAGIAEVAEKIFPQVFRTDFSAPGVALLSFGADANSTTIRRLMVALKEALDVLYRSFTGRRLVYLSMARFNQQVTTKFHLDGAPDEAYLMLGYEPTRVQSQVSIADYVRAAHDWGMEPKTLLSDHNPMYPGHEKKLLPYVTTLEGFDPAAFQILLINNSSLPYREKNMLGVMHQATILTPLPLENRVVNSTMIGSAVEGAEEPIEERVQQIFMDTQEVAGELYKAV